MTAWGTSSFASRHEDESPLFVLDFAVIPTLVADKSISGSLTQTPSKL